MSPRPVPQPALDRMVEFDAHPVVVGVVPDQDPLVVRTAVSLARATGAALHLAFVDTSRYTVEECPDGSVLHAPIDPDAADDGWQAADAALRSAVGELLRADGVGWDLHYLAGRPDRALTHLARAVDAAVIVVGTRAPGAGGRLREAMEGSVAAHLTQHQHRPVLTVPLAVVDWKEIRTPWDR